jgi:hypothetical protein
MNGLQRREGVQGVQGEGVRSQNPGARRPISYAIIVLVLVVVLVLESVKGDVRLRAPASPFSKIDKS